MRFVGVFPESHLHFFGQCRCLGLFQQDEDLIRRGMEGETVSLFLQCLADLHRGFDRVLSDLKVQVIGKQRLELDRGDPAFCQQGAVLLDNSEEMRNIPLLRDDDRLPEQRPALGASDIESVAENRDIRKCDVILRAGQGIGKPCAVKIERDPVLKTQI